MPYDLQDTIPTLGSQPANAAAVLRRTMSAHIHLLAMVGAIIGLIYLLSSSQVLSSEQVVALIIYGLSACLVFAVSSSYHYLHDGVGISKKVEDRFEKLDHASIYLFIAGTYTAAIIGLIEADWRYQLLTIVWTLAGLGLLYTLCFQSLPALLRGRIVYTSLFVLLGWSFMLRAVDIYEAMNFYHRVCFGLGGASYTVGAAVYALKFPNPKPGFIGYHELWHLFVVGGWFCHLLFIIDIYPG